MRIFLDAMGGDNAPQSTVAGAIEALRLNPELSIELGGAADAIRAQLHDCDDVMPRLTVVDCPENITNNESPVLAVRQKKGSPTVVGMLKLRNKEVDGFVSAGSTGAVLAGGMFRLGRIPGIDRPALAPLLPNGRSYFLLIDCGANVDCLPEYLTQFAIMGDAYMRGVMGVEQPRVGLINIGAEEEKGNALTKATYPLLQKAPIRFVGNIEPRDIMEDQADVLVADGFVGNVVLKTVEGMAGAMLHQIKGEIVKDTRSKIGGLLAKPAFKRVKKKLDYTEVGGAPLLGVQGAVIKAHGSSNGHAIACAIRQCVQMLDGKVVDTIEAQLQKLS